MIATCGVLGTADICALTYVNKRLHHTINYSLYKSFGNAPYVLGWALNHGRSDTLAVAAAVGVDIHYNSDELLRDACHRGRLEVVNWLLEHDAQIDAETHQGFSVTPLSALHVAITCSREDIAILLLERGANPYFATPSRYRKSGFILSTAIHLAASLNLLRLTEFIVKEELLSVDQEDDEGRRPLDMSCSSYNERGVAMIKKLGELGANVDLDHSDSLLVCELCLRQYETANALLDIGVKLNNQYSGGQRPLHACITGVRDESQDTICSMLSKLVEAGADVNGYAYLGRTALGEAVGRETPPSVAAHLLTLGADVNAKDWNGRTAVDIFMMNAEPIIAQSGIEKLELLVKAGARMDTPSNTGRTILEWAVYDIHRDPAPDYFRLGSKTKPVVDDALEALLALATPENLRKEYLDDLLNQAFLSSCHGKCETLMKHGATLSPENAMIMAFRRMHISKNSVFTP
ncbi:ankyrin [Hypoxylon sp. EC38]|nr:ankyrin [Hypoxylon sp. EC38]